MAGGIRRKGITSLGDNETDGIKHCPYCNGKLANTKDEYFKNCQGCGRTGIPAYETKEESDLQVVPEPTDNPFDEGGGVVGLNNKRLKGRRETQIDRLKRRIDAEKDEDIKRELRKGDSVQIIHDS